MSEKLPESTIRDLRASITNIPKARWKPVLEAAVTKAHKFIFPYIFIGFFLPTFLDVKQFPAYWDIMLYLRLGILGIGLGGYYLFRKGKLDQYWLVTIPIALIGIHSGGIFGLANKDFVFPVNVTLVVFLVTMALVVMLKNLHLAVILLSTLASSFVFILNSTAYSFEDWANQGGILLFVGAIACVMLVRIRTKMRIASICSEMALHDGQLILDQQNKQLELATQRLEDSNSRLQEEVRRQTQSLRQSNHERDEVVYRLSHDFKVPMVNVRSLIAIVQDEEDAGKRKAIYEMMETNLRRFESLVMDMDHFLSIGKAENKFSSFELRKLIQQVWDDVEAIADSGLRFELEETDAIEIYSDRQKLALTLDTIMRNAIQYQREGESGELKISVRQEADVLHLQLQDNGIGIPEDVLPRVCDLFYRGDSRSTGLGLGLYLAKGTIEQLGGSLSIDSDGQGTQVELALPVAG